MTYYLKKLGHQELGSVTSTNPIPSRGRYLYISIDPTVLSFFPPLSQNQKNDSSLLPIIPLYLQSGSKVYCNFIYHNDIFHGGSRNEYRIYLNNSLENNSILFTKNDIIVIKKDEIVVDDNIQTVYFLDLLKPSHDVYNLCSEFITKSPVRGNHSIYEGHIKEIDAKIELLLESSNFKPVIDTTVAQRINVTEKHVEDLFTATSFRDFVLTGYGNLCAISKRVIKYGDFSNIEAAHIKPKSHGGNYLPNNGLPLSRDLHWAFDKGFFTLKDDYTILVHESVDNEYLTSLDGDKILVPENDFFKPDASNLGYHRQNVFGLFLTSGRL